MGFAWLGRMVPAAAEFYAPRLAFCAQRRCGSLRFETNPTNVVLLAIGCVLMALGLVMLANRSGYVYFVVGPRSVLVVAGVVAMLAFWILRVAK
jgi:hypothetical protein